jgi:hypothetical protein
MKKTFLPAVGKYQKVVMDSTKKFLPQNRTFRFVLYGQIQNGVIVSSSNGIAIFDEDTRHVVCDELFKEKAWDPGPSKYQLGAYDEIVNWGWRQFVNNINSFPRTRQPIVER